MINDERNDMDGADPDTEEIVVEIEETRMALDSTMDELQERLNPDTLKQQARTTVQTMVQDAGDQVRDATVGRAESALNGASENLREMGTGMFETIRQNPLPAALIGAGIGWLWMSSRHDGGGSFNRGGAYRGGRRVYGNEPWSPDGSGYDSYADSRTRYGAAGYGSGERGGMSDPGSGERGGAGIADRVQDRASDMADRVQDGASDMAGRVQSAAGDVADRVGERTGRFVDQAQERAQWMRERGGSRMQQMLRETPLAAGGLALAGGLLLGLLIPETDQESEWLGPARDQFVEQVKETAQTAQQKLQDVAETAASAAEDEAKQQGIAP